MSKIIILAVIAVSVNAQFGDGVYETLKVNTYELKVNPGNPGETPGLNPRHRHRNTETVGGFQNGNFARHDGRLKTNLDSSRIVTDDQNFQPRLENVYIEEGAAFNRPEGQFDVHSSQGRADHLIFEDGNVDVNRRQTQNLGRQNGERIERPNNQRNQNVNGQTNDRQSYNYQSESRNVNNDQNRYNQNKPDRNQGDDSNDRIYFEENRRDQNINNNSQNSGRNNNENRNIGQVTQKANDGENNSRQNKPNTENGTQTNNQNTQQTNKNRNQNSGTNFNESVSKIDSNSRNIADNVSKNHQNYDKEAMDREINNQITKMIFDESVQPELTTKKTTKTTQDNELPSRSNSGKEDKWIWSDGSETTKAPTTLTVDDRAAFVGDQCPTGKTKINNVCVDVDP